MVQNTSVSDVNSKTWRMWLSSLLMILFLQHISTVASQITSLIPVAQIAKLQSLISAVITCVEQRCSQNTCGWWSISPWWWLTNEQWYAAVCLYSEGVVQVSIQVAHQNLGVCQAHTGRLITDFLSTRLARNSLTALTFNIVGNISSTTSVFRWAPGQEEFSCTCGGYKVSWGWGEAWGTCIGKEINCYKDTIIAYNILFLILWSL